MPTRTAHLVAVAAAIDGGYTCRRCVDDDGGTGAEGQRRQAQLQAAAACATTTTTTTSTTTSSSGSNPQRPAASRGRPSVICGGDDQAVLARWHPPQVDDAPLAIQQLPAPLDDRPRHPHRVTGRITNGRQRNRVAAAAGDDEGGWDGGRCVAAGDGG